MRQLHFEISGISGCPYFVGAVHTLTHYKNNSEIHGKIIKLTVKELTRDKWHKHIEYLCNNKVKSNKNKAKLHKTSPYISCNGKFIGGYDSIHAELSKKEPFKGI